MISQSTKDKFKYDENLIKEYEHWSVLFRYQQITIGSLILISKSGKTKLGDLSAEQWAEFAHVSHDVEHWLTLAFGAEKFNYLALMMKDPEVHFHVVPRYSKPIQFAGHEFIDPDWPLATEKIAIELDAEIEGKIQTKLQEIAS